MDEPFRLLISGLIVPNHRPRKKIDGSSRDFSSFASTANAVLKSVSIFMNIESLCSMLAFYDRVDRIASNDIDIMAIDDFLPV